MNESIRLRKARAVYQHAERDLEILGSGQEGIVATKQQLNDAQLAVTLASLDLEAAQGQGDAAALLKQADELLIECVKELGQPGGNLQAEIMKWRAEYKGW